MLAAKSGLRHCDTEYWPDPTEDLRIFGVIRRQSRRWKKLYGKRWKIEQTFKALVILRPAPPGSSYPHEPGTAVATHWEVDSKSFSLRTPVGNLDSPVDLLVWGSDIATANINAPPLAIRSIGYIR